jgi:hypothetical protein
MHYSGTCMKRNLPTTEKIQSLAVPLYGGFTVFLYLFQFLKMCFLSEV